MVNLILILLHLIPIFGIIAIIRKYKKYEANSHRKVYQCNTDYHTPSLATIRSRATTAFDLVENGEIKREVLLNEADPYDSVESVSSFINTLSDSGLVGIICSLKEVNYHG